VLPMFSKRGVERIVIEKKRNPRSIPFRDDEFSQWYCVGKMQRGGFWRPYKVTVIVLECVLMMISSLFLAYTLFYANIETNSVLGYFIMHRNLVSQQNTDTAAMIVQAFDFYVTYPYIWFTWLLLPAGISSIIVPMLTIILLSGQERCCFKWTTFSMHAFSVFALLPFCIDVFIFELDLNARGTFNFLEPDFNRKIYIEGESEFLRSWVWYVSFHERRFMHFNSDETLIRSLEREIPCCGIESVDEYWKPHNFTCAKFPKCRSPLWPEVFSHYVQNDWQKVSHRGTQRLLAYPENCCENCEITNVRSFTQKQKQMKLLKKKIVIRAPTCKSQGSQ
uniref:Uncharacterized protein n=1 Tax=Parascaris univalens TaxID=6257 RepID=A0A915AA26_PARUN